jgi:uncharacterized cupredoxin-like copper-binding protein
MLSRTLAGMLAAAFVLAACGGGSSSEKTTAANGGSDAGNTAGQSVNVAADPGGALKFRPAKLTVAAGKVTFNLTNKSSLPHALEIEGHGIEAKTSTVTGADASVTIKDLKPGTYEFYCPVDGHKAAGMKGTLTVK